MPARCRERTERELERRRQRRERIVAERRERAAERAELEKARREQDERESALGCGIPLSARSLRSGGTGFESR
jgi:hypothetical protein